MSWRVRLSILERNGALTSRVLDLNAKQLTVWAEETDNRNGGENLESIGCDVTEERAEEEKGKEKKEFEMEKLNLTKRS